MELKELIKKIHFTVQLRENKKITMVEMAELIGVNYRTYTEYQRGVIEPLAMKALLNMLSLLEDKDVLEILKEWKTNNGGTP